MLIIPVLSFHSHLSVVQVLAYHRFHRTGQGDDVMVIVNLSSTNHDSYQVGVPRSGYWFIRFHSATGKDLAIRPESGNRAILTSNINSV